MLVGQRKKSQKYFDLSTFNYNLYDSNPCSSLGVINFQKWELFSGSPDIICYEIVVDWLVTMDVGIISNLGGHDTPTFLFSSLVTPCGWNPAIHLFQLTASFWKF